MKIKTASMDYGEVIKLPGATKFIPKRPSSLFRAIMRAASRPDLKAVRFTHSEIGTDRLGKDEPCLFLMNHSSFIDLKIASVLLADRPFNIICTSDGFVGKAGLMRRLGCIPTKKFVSDPSLVRNIKYCLETLHDSVLMYPEASYSFDGTATPLPDSLGKLLKLLKVPVVMIKTFGAFARDPLYNNLKLRDVTVTAEMKYLLSTEEISKSSCDELNAILKKEFSFDNFRWQSENNILINEGFRAEGLNRVLYKCPACGAEDGMEGKDSVLSCRNCGKSYELETSGTMKAVDGETEYAHIPDWYAWERECVRRELLDGTYGLVSDVTVYMMVNFKKVYNVGKGVLTHGPDGFSLTACGGRLVYNQSPLSSYSLYSDYNWYEIGDVICIGDSRALYYCFPEGKGDIVAKTRIAAEELYKLKKAEIRTVAEK